jgi:hypothetical protein
MKKESAVQFETESRIHMGLAVKSLEQSVLPSRALAAESPSPSGACSTRFFSDWYPKPRAVAVLLTPCWRAISMAECQSRWGIRAPNGCVRRDRTRLPSLTARVAYGLNVGTLQPGTERVAHGTQG